MAKRQATALTPYTRMMEERGNAPDSVGRPPDGEVAFKVAGRDKRLAAKAKRRALAVIIFRYRDELRDIYEAEYADLVKKQGFEEVEVVERSTARHTERRPYRGK